MAEVMPLIVFGVLVIAALALVVAGFALIVLRQCWIERERLDNRGE